ncbi:MAG: hypothetical protein JO250_17595 [Armatimonadetes bacterium]|nr:hypothetical protein [Armatimonadota bacterium]
MPARRPLLSVLACLLAFSLVSGAAVPSPLLWRCRHATRVVPASFTAKPLSMPCRMGGGPMSGAMPCCRIPHAAGAPNPSPLPAFGRPDCRPTLVPMASPPVARVQDAQTHLRQHLASALTPGLPRPPTPFPVPLTLPLQQRPPPLVGVFLSVAISLPSLRAPPAAWPPPIRTHVNLLSQSSSHLPSL